MPKLVNSVPKYRKHRASGQAIVTLSGVDHYLGPHNTKVSKDLYDRLIAEWLQNGRQPQLQVSVTTFCVVAYESTQHHKNITANPTRCPM